LERGDFAINQSRRMISFWSQKITCHLILLHRLNAKLNPDLPYAVNKRQPLLLIQVFIEYAVYNGLLYQQWPVHGRDLVQRLGVAFLRPG